MTGGGAAQGRGPACPADYPSSRPVYIFNAFLHPDVVVFPAPGEQLSAGSLLPTYSQEVRPGAGAYTGAMAHSLGRPVEYLDWVGDDLFGEFTLTSLRALGHGTSLVHRYQGDHMVCVSVADDVSQGSTMVATYPEAWRRELADFAAQLAAVPDGSSVYIYSWLWQFAHPDLAKAPAAALIEQMAVERGMTVLLDPNWKPSAEPPSCDLRELVAAARFVHALMPNARDAALMVGQAPPAQLVRRLLDLGSASVVLKNGADGVYVGSSADSGVAHVPAPAVSPRDTTGAGDLFGGAWLAAEGSMVHRAAFAAAAAGLAISRPAGAPLPTRSAIEEVAAGLEAQAEDVS
ncbi:MAG: PfkB family carbohydrate kinase [Bifidobacteriaceae bacterium]|nr:PfkB family carbohydrate kinase [Bifidobacteriaceae bacterium]